MACWFLGAVVKCWVSRLFHVHRCIACEIDISQSHPRISHPHPRDTVSIPDSNLSTPPFFLLAGEVGFGLGLGLQRWVATFGLVVVLAHTIHSIHSLRPYEQDPLNVDAKTLYEKFRELLEWEGTIPFPTTCSLERWNEESICQFQCVAFPIKLA